MNENQFPDISEFADEKILRLHQKFATMPPEIQDLSRSILTDPVKIEVTPVATTAETVDQSVYFVEKTQKRALLVHLLGNEAMTRALVFTRTKSGANRITRHLLEAGVEADVIHGNKSQNARERALESFKDGEIRVLVATDIAARGIDVEGISHVINFDLPNIPESYVHRIGRTGRAGAAGIALSFCDSEERAYLRDIERTIRRTVPVVEAQPFHSRSTGPSAAPSQPARHQQRPSNQNQQRRGGHSRPPQRPAHSAAPATATPTSSVQATGRRYVSKWG